MVEANSNGRSPFISKNWLIGILVSVLLLLLGMVLANSNMTNERQDARLESSEEIQNANNVRIGIIESNQDYIKIELDKINEKLDILMEKQK